MPPRTLIAMAAILFAVPGVALSQNVYTQPALGNQPPGNPTEVSPDRLLAGVRAYPAGVLRALFEVSQQPLIMRQLAEEPDKLIKPETIYPPVSPELQGDPRTAAGSGSGSAGGRVSG